MTFLLCSVSFLVGFFVATSFGSKDSESSNSNQETDESPSILLFEILCLLFAESIFLSSNDTKKDDEWRTFVKSFALNLWKKEKAHYFHSFVFYSTCLIQEMVLRAIDSIRDSVINASSAVSTTTLPPLDIPMTSMKPPSIIPTVELVLGTITYLVSSSSSSSSSDYLPKVCGCWARQRVGKRQKRSIHVIIHVLSWLTKTWQSKNSFVCVQQSWQKFG